MESFVHKFNLSEMWQFLENGKLSKFTYREIDH